jgi:hypothetical protein
VLDEENEANEANERFNDGGVEMEEWDPEQLFEINSEQLNEEDFQTIKVLQESDCCPRTPGTILAKKRSGLDVRLYLLPR